MSVIADTLKRAVLNANCFIGALERRDIITYGDKIRLRGPLYRRQIALDQAGSDRIAELIRTRHPLMIARIGAVELSCVRFYLEKRRKSGATYPERIRFAMSNNAGFFPGDDASLDQFCRLFLDQVRSTDVMAVWFNKFEDVICNDHCPEAELIDLTCLEPFHFTPPWSRTLAGRKVLVVHPFAASIRKQYREKRELLFPGTDLLPEFELTTIKAVQSIAGTKVDYATWFDAYRFMCDEMSRIEFDICLIGAGAYGLPLASFAKSLGRQAIHLGGVTQVLFGIKGKRWEVLYADSTALFFNEHWVRPMESETPANVSRVEKGCYW